MSPSASPAVQTSFTYAPAGFAAKLRVLVAALMRFEPAAAAIYARNAEIRSSGRNWLM
jgi:hypothetical protein